MSAPAEPATKSKAPEGLVFPKEPCFIVLIGKPKSGKTYAVKSLMAQFQKHQPFTFGIVWTGTKFNNAYDFLPDNRVMETYSEDSLLGYIDVLKKKQKASGKPNKPNFLILDDLMGIVKWNDTRIVNWTGNFRHTNTTVFVTAQRLAQGTSTCLRDFTDIAIMFNATTLSAQEHLFDAYGQSMPGKTKGEQLHLFQDVLKSITRCEDEDDKHQALAFVNEKNYASDTYFAWKADPVDDDFKMEF